MPLQMISAVTKQGKRGGEGYMSILLKDFRTLRGTVIAAGALAQIGTVDKERDRRRAEQLAVKATAEVLGNTRTVCRASYVHPVIPEAFRTGALAETYRRSRSTAHLDRIERTVQRLVT